MSRLSEEKGIVYVLKPADHAAGVVGESINTKNCTLVTFLVQCATMTDNGGAGADLTIKSGATDAVQTTAETFYYRVATAAQAAAGADIFGDTSGDAGETEATTLELLKANFDSKLLIIEVPVAMLTDGQPWITLALNADGTAANLSVVAILSGHRYQGQQPPTSI